MYQLYVLDHENGGRLKILLYSININGIYHQIILRILIRSLEMLYYIEKVEFLIQNSDTYAIINFQSSYVVTFTSNE